MKNNFVINQSSILRLVRFIIVGVGATLVYIALVFWLDSSLSFLPAALSSFFAYFASAIFSYFGHQLFTFAERSSEHARQAPKFVATAIVGFSIALLLPAITHDLLNMPLWIGAWGTAIAVPVLNFLLLNYFVFKAA